MSKRFNIIAMSGSYCVCPECGCEDFEKYPEPIEIDGRIYNTRIRCCECGWVGFDDDTIEAEEKGGEENDKNL